MHNARYVVKEHIFTKDNVYHMICELKAAMADNGCLYERLKKQRAYAMLETKEKYSEL